MDAKDFYIVPVFGGIGKRSEIPIESILKGGYVRYKDAYSHQGDVVTYIKRTIEPVQQPASLRRY